LHRHRPAGEDRLGVTNKVSCVNTEPGNEEYSTRAKVSMFGLQSATDFTIPANDSYAC
jgi:hypothetical protein